MRDNSDDILEPEDSDSAPADAAAKKAERAPLDPNDIIPVPVAMEPAEIDERAQAVEAMRARKGRDRDEDEGMR